MISVKVTYQEKFDFTSSRPLDNEDWIKKNISWPGIIRLSGKRTIFMGQNLEILLSTAWLMHNKFGLGSWLGCVWCFIVSPDNGAASFMESYLNLFGTYALLITYFGNFIFGFSSLRLRDILYSVFHLQGKMGKTIWKNKQTIT